MPTLSAYAPAYTTPSSKRDGADFEPDDQWKRQLRSSIEQSFNSMIQEAKDNQQTQLMEGILSRDQLEIEYKQAVNNIKGLAEEQYQVALMKERNERRWIAGVSMLPGWDGVLHQEQENIMNSIKQSNSDNSARFAESPTVDADGSPPLSSAATPAVPHHESEPQSSDPPPTREAQTRDRVSSRTLSSRSSTDKRRHDTNTQRSSSRDREDSAPLLPPSNHRRHNTEHHRPSASQIFLDTELTQEPEEHQPPSSRSSSSRPRSYSEKPWDSSLGRSSASIRSASSTDRHHIGRSPPKNANPAPIQNPDLRRLSTNSQDDPPHPPATKSQINRRGSTASIRSTGSGHSGKSIRHPTTETIPERADDVEESPTSSTVKERIRKSTADKPPREKESKRGSRRDSRPTPVDANVMSRYEHEPAPPPPPSLRSSAPGPSSATMQYATSASSSFIEDRFHPVDRDRPLKSSRPYLDSDSPTYHSPQQYAPRDMPPSARPGPAPPPSQRTSYSGAGDERDFVGPYPQLPLGRPPASPFSGGDRESLREVGRDRDRDRESLRERERDRDRDRDYHPSISHKASFSSYDEGRRRPPRDWGDRDHWDEDREARERDARDRDREYWDRDREQRERERERDWELQRERDRERERDRLHRKREREYTHPHSTPYSARTGGYPTPPSSGSRVAQSHVGVGEYLPMQDIYDDTPILSSSAAVAARGQYGSYRSAAPPPTANLFQDEWDHSPHPDSGRPLMPQRQPSYGRREGERRGTIDGGGPPDLVTDGYSRSYGHVPTPAPAGSIPIPRSSPSNGGSIDDVQPTPAWQHWHLEGGRQRHPPPSSANPNDTWASLARSPPNPSVLAASSSVPPLQPPPAPSLRPTSVAPIAEDHQRRTERRASVKAYHPPPPQVHPNNINHNRRDEYVDDRYSPVAAAAHHHHPPPAASTGIRHRTLLNEDDEEFSADSGRSTSTSEEESEQDRHDGDDEQEDGEDEEEEEEEEEEEDPEDVKARELEEESLRLERERKAADAKIREQELVLQRLKDEERRMAEEARKMDEEVKQKEEELRRKEEEAELVEARRAAERLAEEARKKEEETKRKEIEVKKREDDARRKADDARKLKSEAAKKAEETKRKEEEVRLKEEETKKKEERLKEDEARNKKLKQQAERIAREANKAKETIKKLEEETRKKELQIQEREAALLLREEELKRREAEAKTKEEETKREECRRKEEEAREAKRREDEAAKRREEEARDAARRKEEEAREAARRREDEARAANERDRREQAARRQQQESEHDLDDEFLANLGPRVLEEQARLLQQAQFRKREEEIKRTRAEERKRHDSIGAEGTWMPSFASASPTTSSNANAHPSSSPNAYTSASPGTSPAMSRSPPQFGGSFNPDRNGTSSWGASSSTWSSAPKPTTIPSPSNARTSSSIPSPFGKPRTGSVSSGANPPNASQVGPEEWARRQQEFINNQQEQFRREQEKIEAENQIRAAGKPLSREEMTRLFEDHEEKWNRIAVPGTEQFTWKDIPWPMAKMPKSPEEISQPLIGAYMQSPCWPEKDKTKTTKDRIKDSLKRWHPDRFENRCLVRVVDSDQEKVKEGSGNVVRYLNELLRKENESASGIFAGD